MIENLKLLLISILVTICLPVSGFCATVTGVTITTSGPSYGKIRPASTSGTVKNRISSCSVTGSVFVYSGCQRALYTVTATTTGGSNSKVIKVFITTPSNLANPTGDSMSSSLSLSDTTTGLLSTTFTASGSGNVSYTVPVYGILTVPANAASGNYTGGGYSFYACSCNSSGCPTSTADSRC